MKKTYSLKYIKPTNSKNIDIILKAMNKMRDVAKDREFQLIMKYNKKMKKMWKTNRSDAIKGKYKLQRRLYRYTGLRFDPSQSIYKKPPKVKLIKPPKIELMKMSRSHRNRLLKRVEMSKKEWKKYLTSMSRAVKTELEYRKRNPIKNKKIKFDIKPEGIGVEISTFEKIFGEYDIVYQQWPTQPEMLSPDEFTKWVESTRATLNEFNAIIYQNDFLSGQYAGWIHRVMRALGVPVVLSTKAFLNELKRWVL